MDDKTKKDLGIDNHDPPPEGGFVMRLPDGRRVILSGAGFLTGRWYVRGMDGWPDWDQPVDIYKELNIKRPAESGTRTAAESAARTCASGAKPPGSPADRAGPVPRYNDADRVGTCRTTCFFHSS